MYIQIKICAFIDMVGSSKDIQRLKNIRMMFQKSTTITTGGIVRKEFFISHKKEICKRFVYLMSLLFHLISNVILYCQTLIKS